jgi:branched-chain amino acid transport system substrate-binding protein
MKKGRGVIPIIILVTFLVTVSGIFSGVMGQGQPHANTPPEIYPFSNFQIPHFRHFEERLPYYGAAREYDYPAASELETVKLGFIGPLDGAQEYYTMNGQQMLQGAMLAIEEANKEGGYNGIPFELIARNDIGLWGASGDELVKLYDMGAYAAVGSIDGNNSHVAIRVALKLEIPMVNTGSTDPTLTDTRIPWVIRTNPDDRQFNYALLNEIFNTRGYTRVALIRANSRYARVGTREFIDGARRLGYPVNIRQVYYPGETNFDDYLENIRNADVEAVVIWGEVDEIARIVTQMRESGMEQTVFSSDKVVSDLFVELAGEHANGVIGSFPYNPKVLGSGYESFIEKYRERFGDVPGWHAVHAYDGTKILIESVHKAGLNRALIRDELTSIKQHRGITGDIILDDSWNSITPVWLAEFKDGDFQFWQYQWITQQN